MTNWKERARPALATLLYQVLYRLMRPSWAVSRQGEPLRPGVSALVAARNEEYTLPFCLESLLGFADEIICIDNGSSDRTLAFMRDFARRHKGESDIKVIDLPGRTLGECREAGLEATTRTWHLRWDADFVAKTSGPESVSILKTELLADPRPRAIQMPFATLLGDLEHCSRLYPVLSPGESYLMTFGRDVRYQEDGRFDTVRIPRYYQMIREARRFFVHCSLKSTENLLHRDCYFDWRQATNRATSDEQRERVRDYETFKADHEWRKYGTREARELKDRYWRQAALTMQPFDTALYGDYPEILRREIERGASRFRMVRSGGRAVNRIDTLDSQMQDYQSSQSDREWDPKEFLRRILTDEEFKRLSL